jgi:hypothetical protein
VAVQEMRWVMDRSQLADYYTFFDRNGNAVCYIWTDFIMHQEIIISVKSDRMLFIILRGCWYDILLTVHAPIKDKSDGIKDCDTDKYLVVSKSDSEREREAVSK